MLRRLTPVLDINLGLFSSMSLVLSHPEHQVEIRTQYQQASDENFDEAGNEVWQCTSHRSHTTISKYAEYQVNLFREMSNEAYTYGLENNRGVNDVQFEKHDANVSLLSCKRKRLIKFGTNVDLSDKQKWMRQLQELEKLPPFTQVMSTCNMLSYVGHTILGVNSVQLYMKVPGSRTPGHQENSNFCSVNINIGPGDCEWFCVPEEYWTIISDMCTERGINYLRGSWWPTAADLYSKQVPLYHAIQKPGDMVWVGPGTVHWVQAIGWCNNIAWNVGPLTLLQYQVAVNRHEYYRLQCYRSIIPMIQLSWNLARNQTLISDHQLRSLLRDFLEQSLSQCMAAFKCAAQLGKKVRWHGRVEGELAHYCENCEVEVFNVLFTIGGPDKKYFVHCMDCALRVSSTLDKVIVLQQYHMSDLTQVYDSLKT
jgi:histone demethylase